MLSLGAGYASHLAGEVTNLARLWRITRTDSQVFRFTDHDRDIVIGDETYVSAGYQTTAIKSGSDLSVDNMEASAVFDSASITEDDLRGGLWDDATVEIMECVWSNTALGTRTIRTGRMGRVTYDGVSFRAELLGMTQRLNNNVCRLFSPACDAILGDDRCAVSLSAYTHAFTVTSVTDRLTFTDSSLAQAAAYFQFGVCTWETGANAGATIEVKRHQAGGIITLFLPTINDIAVGDTGTLIAGCDKTFSTCGSKFSNKERFRGFPHLPGNDAVLAPVRA